ncbi:MAG: type II toxin-antitoxin system HipA family toxin [Paracoccaceae bacterium]|nr:type II toxin-antitoxin system HipA family toxin [Paracoccaceae bacterium]MDE2674182.1 type II toxin-antitoxin system HipA family toxin [Paracoccaceae bacterium]MXZ49806.1 type II toxin-antitoxin system HipA family toxin [Paracoccaceae bacterium]MYF44820.1 type II toxin-antitoxin system HipA family toxin [Paracoccaceae bacterium]MYI91030.1 type II toxin-antitoxin system HipA family toxin [Paracoccaceae bacterium]
MNQSLDVYLNHDFVGSLSRDENGILEFSYSDDYYKTGKFGISLSLPMDVRFSNDFSDDFFKGKYRGNKVEAFFSGLLPDEGIRKKLARNLGVSEYNSYSLLEAVGGDCAGALSLFPEGIKPLPQDAKVYVEFLDDDKLLQILKKIKKHPLLAGDNSYRLSLAGAQHKIAVGYLDGRVVLVKGGAPTTHILKPMIAKFNDTVHNELFCMKLAKLMGLDVAEASVHFVQDKPYYLVERYDRDIDNNGIVTRIHQEDFCQALGFLPSSKYQFEGGPDISSSLDLIRQNFASPAKDQIKFLNLIIFNYLIGNSDAHGKNFSLLYVGTKPELAPAYDLISTAVYPEFNTSMAMKIGEEYNPQNVKTEHFQQFIPDTKTAQSSIARQIDSMTEKIVDTAKLLKSNLESEGISSNIFDEIIKIIRLRVEYLSGVKHYAGEK